jgi:hypothetical protein
VCAAALLGWAGAAQATCYTSVPASVAFADDPADSPLAPEVTLIHASVDASCNLTVDPGVAAIDYGEKVGVYIDRDGNPATGDAALFGADEAITSVGGLHGSWSAPLLAQWTGEDFEYGPQPLGTSAAPGAFTASLDRLLITPGATIHLSVISWGVNLDTDYAPERPSSIALPVLFDTNPRPPVFVPPPAPAPAPAPESTPKVPAPQPRPACVVPQLKGKSRHAAERLLLAHHCAVAFNAVNRTSRTVKRGLVMGSLPAKGAKTSARVKLLLSSGCPKRHH